jgi:hypothetical protein
LEVRESYFRRETSFQFHDFSIVAAVVIHMYAIKRRVHA